MPTPWEEYKKRKEELDAIAKLSQVSTETSYEKINEVESLARLSICRDCPALVKFTSQCTHCGCFMPSKVEFKTSTCPLGKW